MKIATLLTAASCALAAFATPRPRASAPADLKLSRGWDGVTLPADAIGTVLATANATARDSHLEKRTTGGVYICTDVNFSGHCGYAVQPLNKCIVLGSEWKDKISSFGPDGCTRCYTYPRPDCTEGNPPLMWLFDYPGSGTGGLTLTSAAVGGVSVPWNDRIESFKCVSTGC